MVIEISMAYDYDIFITTITMEITVQGSARCSSALGLFDHCVDCVDTYLYKGGGVNTTDDITPTIPRQSHKNVKIVLST